MIDVSVVLPVHNEGALVGGVVEEWRRELDARQLSWELLLYDDGSTDDSPAILDRLAREHASVVVRRHANRGHGPTILRGYHEAHGQWVFQADSDGEVRIDGFGVLWDRRHDHDFIVGRRLDRVSPWSRRTITWVSSLSVRLLFGPGIHDVNSPFRLMRAERLRGLLPHVPETTFAPNVLLSGLAVARRLRVLEVPVRCQSRRRGRGSLGGLKAFRMAARSLAQTVTTAVRARRGA